MAKKGTFGVNTYQEGRGGKGRKEKEKREGYDVQERNKSGMESI